MKNLSKDELMTINGGQVPTGYYMDRDVIRANARVFSIVGSFVAGFLVGFFD
jgi:bacteriocin-like protein